MTDSYPAPKRSRWSRGQTCVLLAAVPLLAFAIAKVAVHATVPASDVVRAFEPSAVMSAFGLACAAVYAACFRWQLERLRRERGGVVGDRARPGRAISSPARVLLVSAIVGGIVFALVAYQVGDLINVAADRVDYTLGTIEAKEHGLPWQCAWRLRASARDMAPGSSICVEQAMWERVKVGNGLALVTVTSAAGTQVQWAPESPAPAGGGHD